METLHSVAENLLRQEEGEWAKYFSKGYSEQIFKILNQNPVKLLEEFGHLLQNIILLEDYAKGKGPSFIDENSIFKEDLWAFNLFCCNQWHSLLE